MDTEDALSSPPLPPNNEKEAQKVPDHPRKNGTLEATLKWTGFQGKTLWDWLQLLATLAIPLILGIATLLFGIQQAHLADLQHLSDQKLAQQQHDSDQQRGLDQQRQATLVAYQDTMKDLLLNRGLLTSKSGDEVRVIALTETLSAMRQLDGKRNSFLTQFLQDAQLIGKDPNTGKDHNIVSFYGSDMTDIDLSGANLSEAYLGGADLIEAILIEANLTSAYLGGADLRSTILNKAILIEADLTSANLRGAEVTQQQFDQIYSCVSAILPQGLICHSTAPAPPPAPPPTPAQ